jgi:hypothetical protein
MLVSLSAAFDVVARVVDKALGLNSKPQHISWNSEGWRRAVRALTRDFDTCLAPNQSHGQVFRVLSILRNSIHGEALRTIALRDERKPIENILVVPRSDQHEFIHLLDQLGGRDLWGFRDIADMFTCVRPGMVTEQLMPRAAGALNEIMKLTPVEQLPGITPQTQLMTGPAANDDWWGEDTRRRVRFLSGL